nr:hypothetical protein [Tanacetum cinerariifolium]
MPMEILECKSPYEKLFDQPPVYDHLRVIGCLCYATVIVPQKDKFDNRGIKCVLLGYPMNQKDSKKPKGSLFVHDFPSFGDEFYPETTQTPLPPNPAVVIPNTHIPEPDNENSDFPGIPQQHIAFIANVFAQPEPTRQWNQELTKFLVEKAYEQSKQDYSLFVKVQGDSFTAALVYVDDVLITGNTPTEIYSLKKSLDDKFTIKDIGLAKYFLDAGLTAAKANLSPLPTNLKLSLDKGVPNSNPFFSSPKDVHLHAAIHLLKYLKGTASKGLFYPIQPHLQVTGFTDADWASCLMTRKSLIGYCIFLGHSLVSWKTKKQATVSRYSTEAEYRSMGTTTCELLWLSFLLKDLHMPVKLPITLFCDNKSAQQIAGNPCFHERTKHMDIDSHFTRENVQDGFLQTAFIPSHLQLADIMTKALNSVQHSFLAAKLGVSTAPT